MPNGKVFLIPIEIATGTGHEVIPDQVKEIIKAVDYYLVENLRTARRFISSLRLGLTIEELEFHVLDKKTDDIALSDLMKPLFLGRNVGIMSESGCPGVADPGANAVAYAHRKKVEVVPLVGPSSLMLALMASGMNGQSFAFHGYLPIKKIEAIKKLRALEELSSANYGQTQLFIETPFRNQGMFESILKACRPMTKLCIAANISEKDAYIKTLTIKDWKSETIDIHKKPTVFLIQA